MTDFFALFDQPRQPWLEPEAVKEKYHQLSRVAHPDLGAPQASVSFEEINQAYRVLSDPKLRIEHLLALEDKSAMAERALPQDLQEFFLQIGTLAQKVQSLLARDGGSGALTLSLVKSEILKLRAQADDLLGELSRCYEICITELQRLNETWNHNRSSAVFPLQVLRDRVSYLSRWIKQLKEIAFQLASHD